MEAAKTTSTRASPKRKGGAVRLSGVSASASTLESTILRALSGSQATSTLVRASKKSFKMLNIKRSAEQLSVERVRFRLRGMDREFIAEIAADPRGEGAVLLRLVPASNTPLKKVREVGGSMLTTQEAAVALNVSRPYISKLVDEGVFKDVSRTAGGHRRIPAIEVERVRLEMKAARRAALNELEDITKDLRKRELEDARRHSSTRWVRRAP